MSPVTKYLDHDTTPGARQCACAERLHDVAHHAPHLGSHPGQHQDLSDLSHSPGVNTLLPWSSLPGIDIKLNVGVERFPYLGIMSECG